MPIFSTEGPKEIWQTEPLSWAEKRGKLFVDHILCKSWDFLLLMDLLHEKQRQDGYGYHSTSGQPWMFCFKNYSVDGDDI